MASTEPLKLVQPGVTKKTRGSYSNRVCDGCHKAKRKCNGGSPCSGCLKRSYECTYSRQDGRTQRATPNSRRGTNIAAAFSPAALRTAMETAMFNGPVSTAMGAVRPAFSMEDNMGKSYLRRYCVSLFAERMDAFGFLVGRQTLSRVLQRLDAGELVEVDYQFVATGVTALVQHNLHQFSEAAETVKSAKAMVPQLMEYSSHASVAGTALLAQYSCYTGNSLATDMYAAMALTLAHHLPRDMNERSRAHSAGVGAYPSFLCSEKEIERSITAFEQEYPRSSPVYPFRLRFMSILRDVVRDRGSSLLFYVENWMRRSADGLSDPDSLFHFSGRRRREGLLVHQRRHGIVMVDVFGMEHKALSPDAAQFLLHEVNETAVDMGEMAVMEHGIQSILCAESGVVASLHMLISDLLRALVTWASGNVEETASIVKSWFGFLKEMDIQFAPPCFVDLLAIPVEFSFWQGDKDALEMLHRVLSRMAPANARVKPVVPLVESMIAALANTEIAPQGNFGARARPGSSCGTDHMQSNVWSPEPWAHDTGSSLGDSSTVEVPWEVEADCLAVNAAVGLPVEGGGPCLSELDDGASGEAVGGADLVECEGLGWGNPVFSE